MHSFLRLIPEQPSGAILMASSSILYGVYPRQSSACAAVRNQAHWRIWLPVLAFSMLLAIESTPYLGWDHTNAPLRRIAELLCGSAVDSHWNLIHHYIRKTGHFLGYGIFSLIVFRGVWFALRSSLSRRVRQLCAHGLAIAVCFLAAGTDEWHQSFLPNRTGQFSDVLLDTCGAVVLGVALFLVMVALEGLRRSKASRRPVKCDDWSSPLPAAASAR